MVQKAEQLSGLWEHIRKSGTLSYDVFLWQEAAWPALSLSWLPSASGWALPAGLQAYEAAARQHRLQDFEEHAAAFKEAQQQQQHMHEGQGAEGHDGMAVDSTAQEDAAGQPGTNHQPPVQQLVQMPLDYQYLLAGSQASGQEASHVDLYMVQLPGQQQQLQPGQQVLMHKGDMRRVLRIHHGTLDVNCIAVKPQQPNLLATCSDQPQVYLFGLEQQAAREWPDVSAVDWAALAAEPDTEDAEDTGMGASSSGSGSPAAAAAGAEGSQHDTDADAASGSGCECNPDAPSEHPSHPQAVLTAAGRSAGGFGLEFNPVKPGLLLGADLQGGVQLWDVGHLSSSSGGSNSGSTGRSVEVQAMQEATHFVPCGINDVSWHRHGSAYALATERGQVVIQDLRAPTKGSSGGTSGSRGGGSGGSSRSRHGLTGFTGADVQPPRSGQVHVQRLRQQQQQQRQRKTTSAAQDCLCVAFDPLHATRLASAGADGLVQVLDMRHLDQPVDTLGMHAGSVTSLAWSHSLPGLLVSAGEDATVLLWDANKLKHAGSFRLGQQQQQQQQQGLGLGRQQQQGLGLPACSSLFLGQVAPLSAPGLLFVHGGHLSPVAALALNPERPWLIASSTEGSAEGRDSSGRMRVVQPQHVMVWEVNRAVGLLC